MMGILHFFELDLQIAFSSWKEIVIGQNPHKLQQKFTCSENFFSKLIFGMITIAYPQNLETKYFLKKFKTKKINHLGNLKFAENSRNRFEIINKIW